MNSNDKLFISDRVAVHHLEQFGLVDWARLAAKLGEESGELQGAIVRQLEQRDGRQWTTEIHKELLDVLTVLHVVASRLDLELSDQTEVAAEAFLARRWNNVTKQK